jgi:Uma2 family endonuclease
MSNQTTTTPITLDDLLQRLAEDSRVEVVDGIFRESNPMTAGYLHLHIISNIYRLLLKPIESQKLGLIGPDGLTCVLHTTEEGIQTTQIPDVVYIARESIPSDWDREKPFPGAPTLAVEVLSPSERPQTIQSKIEDYLTHGTREVWVVYPENRKVYQYRQAERNLAYIYQSGQTFSPDALFPGVVLAVDDFFQVDKML